MACGAHAWIDAIAIYIENMTMLTDWDGGGEGGEGGKGQREGRWYGYSNIMYITILRVPVDSAHRSRSYET